MEMQSYTITDLYSSELIKSNRHELLNYFKKNVKQKNYNPFVYISNDRKQMDALGFAVKSNLFGLYFSETNKPMLKGMNPIKSSEFLFGFVFVNGEKQLFLNNYLDVLSLREFIQYMERIVHS